MIFLSSVLVYSWPPVVPPWGVALSRSPFVRGRRSVFFPSVCVRLCRRVGRARLVARAVRGRSSLWKNNPTPQSTNPICKKKSREKHLFTSVATQERGSCRTSYDRVPRFRGRSSGTSAAVTVCGTIDAAAAGARLVLVVLLQPRLAPPASRPTMGSTTRLTSRTSCAMPRDAHSRRTARSKGRPFTVAREIEMLIMAMRARWVWG